MKVELLLSPDTVALASQISEVFFVGAEPDGPREHLKKHSVEGMLKTGRIYV